MSVGVSCMGCVLCDETEWAGDVHYYNYHLSFSEQTPKKRCFSRSILMYEQVLIDQNPHWRGDLHPDTVPRDKMTQLREYLQLPHIISLVGVRRCGKSTLVRQLLG